MARVNGADESGRAEHPRRRELSWAWMLPMLRVEGAVAMVKRKRTTVPAQIVVLLRGALYTELARACEDAPALMPEAHERTGWADVLVRIERARGALDAIGWEAPAEQRDVTIALDATMIEALEDAWDGWNWLAQQEKTESAEGRGQARVKAETIARFLASVTERPSPDTPKRGDA